jgi:phosphoribosylglycinamide formyltransferase-1
MKSIVILISGRGSNMEAILKAALPLEIRAVISNRPQAAGLATAAAAGIPTHGLDHKQFASRDAFDQALMQCIDQYSPDYVILAGFMRVLTEAFIGHYPRRIINIHPSLLPSFPGLHTHRQALDAGVKIHGATVHFVTPQLDHGPTIIQAAVPVLPDDDEASLAARVLAQEHRIYPQALRWLAADQVEFSADGVVQVQKHRVSDTAGAQYLTAPGI